MAVRIVKLGSPRTANEGLRIGTVRRPPRGVRKTDYAEQDWFDLWYPNLAPSVEIMQLAHEASTPREWQIFKRKYRAEMLAPDNSRTLDLLAALSRHSDFSVGCYCEDEAHCHRSVLRELLTEKGAVMA